MSPPNVVYVITGERGSGKSTLCGWVAHEAGRRGHVVAGIVTEREGGADPVSTRRVVDLRSGEARLFGSREHGRVPSEEAGCDANVGMTGDPLTPGWGYENGVFSWANTVLARSTPCDLLVIDEVGPLELQGGRGWFKALEVLDSGGYRVALVVCRPGLVQSLKDRLRVGVRGVLEVTPENRDALRAVTMAALDEVLSSS